MGGGLLEYDIDDEGFDAPEGFDDEDDEGGGSSSLAARYGMSHAATEASSSADAPIMDAFGQLSVSDGSSTDAFGQDIPEDDGDGFADFAAFGEDTATTNTGSPTFEADFADAFSTPEPGSSAGKDAFGSSVWFDG